LVPLGTKRQIIVPHTPHFPFTIALPFDAFVNLHPVILTPFFLQTTQYPVYLDDELFEPLECFERLERLELFETLERLERFDGERFDLAMFIFNI